MMLCQKIHFHDVSVLFAVGTDSYISKKKPASPQRVMREVDIIE